ncbi:MAG TPA: tryptophan--tRNA ligase [Bryobacteraceae bacterium]|nr:tryptophan--tRNA ligase [Bryobacteraceae bacterium]
MKKRVLSGIQPTGSPHIGNYLGALKNWARIQYDYDSIYCIVDLHAITAYQKPEELHGKIQELAGILLAIGIDKKSLVLQSRVAEHAELAWLLTCVTPVGWLERMTQYKAKSQSQETIGDGLLQYPVLMAADILLYQADVVPVGEDQRQHVELTRDIAQRFNSLYPEHGETFTMPATHLPTVGARIMGLDDPEKKMSKSEPGSGHAIAVLDPPDVIRKKVMRATTDSKPGVDFDDPGAGVRNLLAIYQAFTEAANDQMRERFSGMRYGDFKKQVAESVVAGLEPIQQRYRAITVDEITQALRLGSENAQRIADGTLKKVKQAMGLFTVD